MKKYLDKTLSMELGASDEHSEGEREESVSRSPAPSHPGGDEPDMGIRKLMKRQPAMQRRSETRENVKRPSLLDVFRGSHWDKAIGPSTYKQI